MTYKLNIRLHPLLSHRVSLFFFFNDTATTEIYTLSLHDALPISARGYRTRVRIRPIATTSPFFYATEELIAHSARSEEHTSELQSRENLVCRLLLEKKKKAHEQRTGALTERPAQCHVRETDA